MWINAFVERYAGAHCKDDDCYRKAPEVDLLAVTEWEFLVSRLAGAFDPVGKPNLVAGVDQRMTFLGQHRRTAGARGRHKLGDGD